MEGDLQRYLDCGTTTPNFSNYDLPFSEPAGDCAQRSLFRGEQRERASSCRRTPGDRGRDERLAQLRDVALLVGSEIGRRPRW